MRCRRLLLPPLLPPPVSPGCVSASSSLSGWLPPASAPLWGACAWYMCHETGKGDARLHQCIAKAARQPPVHCQGKARQHTHLRSSERGRPLSIPSGSQCTMCVGASLLLLPSSAPSTTVAACASAMRCSAYSEREGQVSQIPIINSSPKSANEPADNPDNIPGARTRAPPLRSAAGAGGAGLPPEAPAGWRGARRCSLRASRPGVSGARCGWGFGVGTCWSYIQNRWIGATGPDLGLEVEGAPLHHLLVLVRGLQDLP